MRKTRWHVLRNARTKAPKVTRQTVYNNPPQTPSLQGRCIPARQRKASSCHLKAQGQKSACSKQGVGACPRQLREPSSSSPRAGARARARASTHARRAAGGRAGGRGALAAAGGRTGAYGALAAARPSFARENASGLANLRTGGHYHEKLSVSARIFRLESAHLRRLPLRAFLTWGFSEGCGRRRNARRKTSR